jgi:hypothetical protein
MSMAFKTTTDIYALRASNTLEIPAGSGGSANTTSIETNLDSLNREILLIWEVDFWVPTLGTQIANVSSAASTESFVHSLQINKASGFFSLADVEHIASRTDQIVKAGANPQVLYIKDLRPDSKEFTSQTAQNSPLAIVVGDKIYFRQSHSNDLTTVTADTLVATCRMMVQRAKADADTYAALLQGYSL